MCVSRWKMWEAVNCCSCNRLLLQLFVHMFNILYITIFQFIAELWPVEYIWSGYAPYLQKNGEWNSNMSFMLTLQTISAFLIYVPLQSESRLHQQTAELKTTQLSTTGRGENRRTSQAAANFTVKDLLMSGRHNHFLFRLHYDAQMRVWN